jgi:intracellular septation protein A
MPEQQQMTEQQPTSSWWQILGPHFPYQQFVFGALVPITLFYTFQRFDQAITGALLAAGWGLGVLVITYLRSRRFDLFAGLATPLVLIELIGTWITQNPDFYLASVAVESALWGVIFLGSVFLPRPLIQIIAELLNPGLGSEKFLQQQKLSAQLYRSTWQIVTAIWGVVDLLKAVILVFAQLWLPLEPFLFLRTALGIPVTVVLIVFSMRFPGWYWERAKTQP